jgi:quinol monooxygenase YgiN
MDRLSTSATPNGSARLPSCSGGHSSGWVKRYVADLPDGHPISLRQTHLGGLQIIASDPVPVGPIKDSNSEERYAWQTLLIVGTVRLPPENLGRARPIMKQMVEASRAEGGCLAYSYAEDILDSGLIHVIEAWSDRPSLDRHFASTHIAEWRSCWAGLESLTRT